MTTSAGAPDHTVLTPSTSFMTTYLQQCIAQYVIDAIMLSHARSICAIERLLEPWLSLATIVAKQLHCHSGRKLILFANMHHGMVLGEISITSKTKSFSVRTAHMDDVADTAAVASTTCLLMDRHSILFTYIGLYSCCSQRIGVKSALRDSDLTIFTRILFP